MNVVVLGIEWYFAALLGTAGLAKIVHPSYFLNVLRRQNLYPKWLVSWIGSVFPYLQVLLAGLLLGGIALRVTSLVCIFVFASFIWVEVALLLRGNSAECGCYGAFSQSRVDDTSVIVSTLWTVIAAVHLGIILSMDPIPWLWRLPGIFLLGGVAGWIIARMLILPRFRSRGSTNWYSPQREGV